MLIGILTAGRNDHKSRWSYWAASALSQIIRKLSEKTTKQALCIVGIAQTAMHLRNKTYKV
jgi:hypothetical protein